MSSNCRLALPDGSALAISGPPRRSSDGFLSSPASPPPVPPPACRLVSGKFEPTPDRALSDVPPFAAAPCCDDCASPPDCRDFLPQPLAVTTATLPTKTIAAVQISFAMGNLLSYLSGSWCD